MTCANGLLMVFRGRRVFVLLALNIWLWYMCLSIFINIITYEYLGLKCGTILMMW